MKHLLPLAVLSIFIGLSSCSKSPLHEPMEAMGDAFGAIRKAEDLTAVGAEIDAFIEAVEIAKAQPLPEEHQEKFQEGINKVLTAAQELKSSLAAGDMDAAQSRIKLLGETAKKYHEEFGVEH